MFDLDAIYEDFLKLSFEEKVDSAREYISEIAETLLKLGVEENKRIKFYLALTLMFVSADKSASEAEVKLFNEIFGTTFKVEEFNFFFQNEDDENLIEATNKIIDHFPEETKFAACAYGLVFLSVDGEITDKEKEVFENILA